MGSCRWPGVTLLSHTVNCSCLGVNSHLFHLFLLKPSGILSVSLLHLPFLVGQSETRNEVLLQKQKRVLQFTHLSKGISFAWSNCPYDCQNAGLWPKIWAWWMSFEEVLCALERVFLSNRNITDVQSILWNYNPRLAFVGPFSGPWGMGLEKRNGLILFEHKKFQVIVV